MKPLRARVKTVKNGERKDDGKDRVFFVAGMLSLIGRVIEVVPHKTHGAGKMYSSPSYSWNFHEDWLEFIDKPPEGIKVRIPGL